MGGLNPLPIPELDQPVEVDVTSVVPGSQGAFVRGWVRAPAALDPVSRPLAFVCFPGGACTTGYFDLEVPGRPGYSMATHVVRRGVIVVAFDHLGIGESTPVDDLFTVTPSTAAAVNHHASRVAIDRLRAGTLLPEFGALPDLVSVGAGHSMGGMLLGVQQGRFETFDAVAVLGHGGDGLPHHLTDAERAVAGGPLDQIEETVVALARHRFATPSPIERTQADPTSFFAADVPRDVRAAFARQRTRLLSTCGLTSMIPGATDAEKAAITAPVFLAFGDQDLTDQYAASLARYEGCNDATLFVLTDSAHCHNQARTRTALWDRLTRWATSIAH